MIQLWWRSQSAADPRQQLVSRNLGRDVLMHTVELLDYAHCRMPMHAVKRGCSEKGWNRIRIRPESHHEDTLLSYVRKIFVGIFFLDKHSGL